MACEKHQRSCAKQLMGLQRSALMHEAVCSTWRLSLQENPNFSSPK